MHIGSLDNMSVCIKKHLLPGHAVGGGTTVRILDVGGADVNGSYRPLFDVFEPEYTVFDLDPIDGVDMVPTADGLIPAPECTFDIVISGQTFEHAATFWRTFEEMVRVCADDGWLIVLAPSGGPIHRYPVDCYRFMPDSMQALADLTGAHLIDAWRDPRGPFHDVIGVFRKSPPDPSAPPLPPVTSVPLTQVVQNDFPPGAPPEAERGAGAEPCNEFLERVHRTLEPRFYVEIGVEYGTSLRLSACPALGIDPAPALTEPLAEHQQVALMTSDDFFAFADVASMLGPLDLAYIDGMHQIEYVMKDFMNIERHCHAGSVVIIDDVFPVHPLQAERQRASRFWTGDIWKIIPILRGARPDLLLLPVDTEPTGSLMVIGLDPVNDELWDRFDLLVDMAISQMTEVHDDILTRYQAFDPRDPVLRRVLGSLRQSRAQTDVGPTIERLRGLVAGSMPRKVAR
jgi:hypothetical protein